MKISKAQAFIEIAEAVNDGNETKANNMINVVGRAIAQDRRKKEFNQEIKLSRKDKVHFAK